MSKEQREEAARLYSALIAAQEAYQEYGLNVVDSTGDGPSRCAISGQVVLETDEYLEDLETGEVVLRSMIGLPPRETENC